MKTFAQLGFPGRLMAVEGLNGSVKSTQIYLLKRWLETQKLKVFFSEWGSSGLVKTATSKGKKQKLVQCNFAKNHALDYWKSGMAPGLSRDMFDSLLKYQGMMAEQFQRLQKAWRPHHGGRVSFSR